MLLQDSAHEDAVGLTEEKYYFYAPASGYYRVMVDAGSYDHYFALSMQTDTETIDPDDLYAFIYLEMGDFVDISVVNEYVYSSSEKEYTIVVTLAVPVFEGSPETPVELPLVSTYYAEVGISAIGGDSYYTFTTEEAGNYAITSSTSVDLELHQRATYDYILEDSWTGVVRAVLDANTTYYLKAVNDGPDNEQFSLQITKEDEGSEGEISDPLLLSPDLTHRAKVGLDDWNDDNSYYRFTTEANTSLYVISLLKRTSTDSLYFALYGDSNFDNRLTSSTSDDRAVVALTPSTTYYLKVNNFFGNDEIEYDLTLAAPEGTLTITENENLEAFPVALQKDMEYRAHVGTLSGDGSESYYRFTTSSELKPIMIVISEADDLDLYLYSDSDYTEQIGFADDGVLLMEEPSADTTYYIKVFNYTNSDPVTFSLLVQPDP